VDTRNAIANNTATAASNHLTENVIGVLEFSSVPESYTITRRFENMYFFIKVNRVSGTAVFKSRILICDYSLNLGTIFVLISYRGLQTHYLTEVQL